MEEPKKYKETLDVIIASNGYYVKDFWKDSSSIEHKVFTNDDAVKCFGEIIKSSIDAVEANELESSLRVEITITAKK